ncbi:hypothetical protein MJO28_006696 [Puccinia striiformis f. sp. tritici]|uniref:Uncharacterized protein n=3 Tax=Puccinia striiformis TaxID=27350 RepID=A0A2S4W5X9_9BASI|nr:hypothetical protein MJO28_006696 [Puccinia striiformis f. sp. tritici]KAI9619695.1 hypothetical protein H4Q26_014077 [Puccinia striiformis f. sp. tritici PST-130]POW10983.1 hypothetical protein PSTT_05717 [Puccinia striiformis]POW17180.1 hypothetical protein PSHT_06483 [Puccinia striiformis]
MEHNKEQTEAIVVIEQAIREDNIWAAGWKMIKFSKKGYIINKNQLDWLESEQKFQSDYVLLAAIKLQEIAQQDAHVDFYKWRKNGLPCSMMAENSLDKHQHGPEVVQLHQTIMTMARASGYMEEIIFVGLHGIPQTETVDGIEMGGMGAAPTVNDLKNVTLEDNDWILIQEEEAQKGHFAGHQWSILENTKNVTFEDDDWILV